MKQSVQSLSDQRVLVTGGTGIIGSWLVDALEKQNVETYKLIWDQELLRNTPQNHITSNATEIHGTLTDINILSKAINEHKITVVFHLGAQAIVETAFLDPLQTFETNIRGTYNLLEACRVSKSDLKSIVIASSDKAYGTHNTLPYEEDFGLRGIYPYEVSKSCTDLIARSYAISYNLPISIARCGNVYGGGDLNWNRLIPGTIRDLINNRNPVIRSDGSFLRDYIYVKDIVNAYISLALNTMAGTKYGEAFNFGNNNPISVLDLVNTITNIMDKTHLKPYIQNVAQGEIHSQYLNSEKAKRILNWDPVYSLKEGLTETINWYSNIITSSHEHQ